MPDRHALVELLAQHDMLRGLMDHCEDLADGLDGHPDADPAALTRELANLRLAFEKHNAFEEKILKPVLLDHDELGPVRVSRMFEDHVQEHRQIHDRLVSPVTATLRDVIETLRAHLDAEERYLFTSRILRDDAVTVARLH